MNDFYIACKENGFRKQKSTYARCYGDGILQTLYLGTKEYISPDSEEYSPSCRKAASIRVGIRSLYGDLREWFFVPGDPVGQFSPCNFYGKRATKFMGFQTECQEMLDVGFRRLNEIRSQQEFLQAREELDLAEGGPLSSSCLDLCRPYLIAGQPQKALTQITGIFMQNCLAFYSNSQNPRIRAGMELKPDVDLLEQFISKEQELIELWKQVIRYANGQDCSAFLSEQLKENIRYVRKYNIPLVCPSEQVQKAYEEEPEGKA